MTKQIWHFFGDMGHWDIGTNGLFFVFLDDGGGNSMEMNSGDKWSKYILIKL